MPRHAQLTPDSDSHDSPGSVTLPATAEPTAGLKEIGHLAQWKVSSAKPGNGVRELRSENTSEFWQSDGAQPHSITAHFIRRVHIAMVRIYLDYEADESYTPTKLAIKAGTGYHDLIEVSTVPIANPHGWQVIDLQAPVIKCFVLQVVVVANHQNGKDTHVRGLQVFARSP